MGRDETHVPAQLPTIDAARARNLELVLKWMEVAGRMLADPSGTPGKELNRAGELLLSAGSWLAQEREQVRKEARLAVIRAEREGGAA